MPQEDGHSGIWEMLFFRPAHTCYCVATARGDAHGLPNASPLVEPSDRVDVVERTPQVREVAIQRAKPGWSEVLGGGAVYEEMRRVERKSMAPV